MLTDFCPNCLGLGLIDFDFDAWPSRKAIAFSLELQGGQVKC